jgi:hypothetical protein
MSNDPERDRLVAKLQDADTENRNALAAWETDNAKWFECYKALVAYDAKVKEVGDETTRNC